MKLLTRQEELVLLAIWNLRENAYLVTIQEHISKVTGKEWTIGAVYVPLNRLEKLGYAHTRIGDPTPERGGRKIKYFKLSKDGFAALEKVNEVNAALWTGFPGAAFDKGPVK